MRTVSKLIVITGLMMSSSTFAFFNQDWILQPQLGFDVNLRTQSFDRGFGKEHFAGHYPDTNFYVGAKLHQYIGLELGYEHMYPLQKTQYYFDTSTDGGAYIPVLGTSLLAGQDGELFFSKAKANGVYLDLIGLLPICKERTHLTASVGIAWMTMHYETVFTSPNQASTLPAYWHSGSQALARLGVGVRHLISDNFGVRLQAQWQNTAQLDAAVPLQVGFGGVLTPASAQDYYTAKPKNSFVVGLGFFLQLV